jgi:gag-polypeptide of LTR copia-type
MSSSLSATPTAFSHQIPIKLTHDNYLSWKFLILPHTRGHDFFGYLDGSFPPPPSTLSSATGATLPNPEYIAWMRQDQLLLAWLLSSISEYVVSQLVHCATSLELWQELRLRYSSQFLARVMDLKMQIHSLQKGHLTMQSYLDQKRSLADRLRLIGSPVSDADLQLFILHGLSIEYDYLVVSLNARCDAVPFNELCGLLLTHEQRLNKYANPIPGVSSVFPSALASATSQLHSLPQAHTVSSTSSVLGALPLSEHDLMAQFSAFLSSKGSWRPKQANRSSSADRFVCQLCLKKGHTADRCYKRFDASYKPPPPRSNSKNNSY